MTDQLPDDWVSVSSQAVAQARYDRDRGVLVIRFVKGTRDYDYPCAPDQARAFFSAASHGRWLAATFARQ